jgi:methylglyoxal synthase
VDLVIFLRSGMEVSPHEDDMRMLLRATNLTNCPLATNIATAEVLLAAFEAASAEHVAVAREKVGAAR